ncbi:MAG TPA: dTDP-4-dehydrorhamnose 3,5-epimerase family protein [Candidatus Omnitrophota bacterium]|nr:dTDP-4-dehydrorhamnose 3,5-epimerase family protein [Candidatus Omnitrophota bacterium]HRZ15834.1 dTDP-4-dehydrorhamnose 3,5-epimerase family protein [Candidatus Omnitrophota bacterium]
MYEPGLIQGEVFVDDRGSVSFVNGFDLSQVKRFYAVANHRMNFVRAWHGHKKESKYVFAAAGSALVAAVRIDNWEKPSRELPVQRFVLSATKPSILYIPAGYANGFMNLSEDARLIFFSTSTLEESKSDDFRFDARYWDPWQVIER